MAEAEAAGKDTLFARASTAIAISGFVVAALCVLEVPGAAAAYMMVAFVSALAVGLGAWHFRPPPAWAFFALLAAGLLFAVAAAIRDAVGSTGDLTSHRSLLPDAFSLPGYVLLALSLLGLLRKRRGHTSDWPVVLDAAVLTIGALIVAWVLLLDPALAHRDAAWIAKAAIVVYPPVSVFLVAIAAQLAFSSGRRNRAFRLLLMGVVAILCGDVMYVLIETHAVEAGESLAVAPYAVSWAAFAAATLHPSLREVGSQQVASRRLPLSRITLVSAGLIIPATVIAGWATSGWAERVVAMILAATLTATATTRLLWSIHMQAESDQLMEWRATHDYLTELPNRQLMFESLESKLVAAAAEDRSVAVIFLDVDQFKLVNDTYGHATGDALLVAAAERLNTLATPHLIGRLSGDEFVVVAELGVQEARILAERLRAGFVEPLSVGPQGTDQYVTVSVGLVIADRHHRYPDAASLLRDADTAMYRSKELGRNAVSVFDLPMRRRVERRVQLERELRQALEDGQITVAYQPIVDLATGRPEGVEALARWNGPSGAVSPGDFIPVAEDSGLIVPLGAHVMATACEDMANWRLDHQRVPLSLSVNLSAKQLRYDDVAELVASTLEQTRLPSSALWIEITESVLLEDTLDTMATFAALTDYGVRIVADDFGTGFSSLAYLKQFPVERVKIDQSFVAAITERHSMHSLTAAIVAIGDTLNLEVVAEGVETALQARRLHELGCKYAQGYYYSPAVDYEQLPAVIGRLMADSAASRLTPSSPQTAAARRGPRRQPRH